MKKCKQCLKEKPLVEFRKAKGARDGLQPWCNPCRAAWQRYYTKTPSGMASYRNTKFKSQYGITLEAYNQMLLVQAGNCLICGENQSRLKRKLCVDHDHGTGRVRGLLCGQCNVGIGSFKDDVQRLQSAILYLKRVQGDAK